MERQEKVQEIFKMLKENDFPLFVSQALEDTFAKGNYTDAFVDVLHEHVTTEVELLDTYGTTRTH